MLWKLEEREVFCERKSTLTVNGGRFMLLHFINYVSNICSLDMKRDSWALEKYWIID